DGFSETLHVVSDTANTVVTSSFELSASAEQSTQATSEISTTIQDMASGSENQLRSVEESSETITQIAEYAEQINSNAQNATNLATDSSEVSREGRASIEEMIEQMNLINRNV